MKRFMCAEKIAASLLQLGHRLKKVVESKKVELKDSFSELHSKASRAADYHLYRRVWYDSAE